MGDRTNYHIAFSPPDISEREVEEVSAALRSGWITTGPRTKRFEKEIAAFVHANKCVCLNSATAALELALRICDIGPGDEVIICAYKSYGKTARNLNKTTNLLSRSSIEIAFRKDDTILFDELFGVGATYVAGEENDFLIRCLKSKKVIVYKPITTVFHEKKARKESPAQLIAKGAFYAKHFGFIVSNLVLLRDFI